MVVKKETILVELSAVAKVVEWVRELVGEMVGRKVDKTDTLLGDGPVVGRFHGWRDGTSAG